MQLKLKPESRYANKRSPFKLNDKRKSALRVGTVKSSMQGLPNDYQLKRAEETRKNTEMIY